MENRNGLKLGKLVQSGPVQLRVFALAFVLAVSGHSAFASDLWSIDGALFLSGLAFVWCGLSGLCSEFFGVHLILWDRSQFAVIDIQGRSILSNDLGCELRNEHFERWGDGLNVALYSVGGPSRKTIRSLDKFSGHRSKGTGEPAFQSGRITGAKERRNENQFNFGDARKDLIGDRGPIEVCQRF